MPACKEIPNSCLCVKFVFSFCVFRTSLVIEIKCIEKSSAVRMGNSEFLVFPFDFYKLIHL